VLPYNRSNYKIMPPKDHPSPNSVNHPENSVPRVDEHVDPIDVIMGGLDPNMLRRLDDDAIEDLVDQHPAAQEAMRRLREARATHLGAREAEGKLMRAAQETRKLIGGEIRSRLGLEVIDEEGQRQRQEQERQQALARIKSSLTGQEDERQLLGAFGLVDETTGKMSSDSIQSPLFRNDTQQAFNKYLRFASNFDAMQSAEEAMGVGLKHSAEASNLRGEAHNTVANFVTRDLGLEFDDARKIVTKMREDVIPGSGETMNYAALLRGEKLANRYGHDAAAMTRDQLGPLLPPQH